MSNAHDAIESDLVCPKCGEANNAKRSHMIVWDARLQTAFCACCAHGGSIELFIPVSKEIPCLPRF
jgi:hypothetical protein